MQPSRRLFVSALACASLSALTCYAPPVGLNITNEDAVVSHATSSCGLGGTEANMVGNLYWTNQLNSNHGSIPAADPWQISGIGLSVGDNVITVSGEDTVGSWHWDSVTITRLGSPLAFYVSTNGGNVYPYTNWADAARVIQDAVGVAGDGDTVLVTNGEYRLTSQIGLSNGVTVRSVNGAADTIVDGNYPAFTNRCFLLSHTGACLDSLTIRNGYRALGEGGGAYMTGGAVRHCLMVNNRAGTGGGIYALDGGLVTHCRIQGNTATADGGGLYIKNSGGRAVNCLITSNYAGGYGGGAYIYAGDQIRNSTICDNTAGTGVGGGTAVEGYGTLENCIIYYNSNQNGTGIGGGFGPTYDHCCITPNPGGTAIVTAPPQFIDRPAGDYRLGYGSPCIDTGKNLSVTVTNDLDGVVRPLDGNFNGSPAFDLGCYEYDRDKTDTDGDTMADGWEHRYYLNPTNAADAAQHADADGIPNVDEWDADTDPTDPDSYLGFRSVGSAGAAFVVTYTGGTQAWKILESSPNLMNPIWSFVTSNKPPTSVTNVVGFGSVLRQVFFRIRAYR